MINYHIAEKLEQMALMSEYAGENPFRARAYLKASEIILYFEKEISELDEDFKIPGIGEGIKKIIDDFICRGSSSAYNELKRLVPKDFFFMLNISGIGIKKLRCICDALKIETLDELAACAKRGDIRRLKGFAEAGEKNIIAECIRISEEKNSKLFFVAERLFYDLKHALCASDSASDFTAAGELARKLPVINRLRCVMSYKCATFEEALDKILMTLKIRDYELIRSGNISYVYFKYYSTDFPVEIFAIHESLYNRNLERILSFSDDYLTAQIENFDMTQPIAFASCGNEFLERLYKISTEIEKYDFFDIAPEYSQVLWKKLSHERLRQIKKFDVSFIKGLFHVHSLYSDGCDSAEEIAIKIKNMGLGYVGISDHSKSSFYANGLDEARISSQINEIERLNERYPSIKIFKGLECDILKDGSLDMPDDVLKTLDFVIVSIHSNFKMKIEEMTERIIKAISNPYVTMLGHMCGRLLTKRKGYDIDAEKIFQAAQKNNVIIELNSNPYRMDADYSHFQTLNELGVMISINPDAHSAGDIGACLQYGVNAVNLGGMPADKILNTFDAQQIIELFNKKKEAIRR